MRSLRLLVIALAVLPWLFLIPDAFARDLTFEDRVNAQEAIERVYFSHQIGAARSFKAAVPRSVIEDKVRLYLKKSVALERFFGTTVTAEMLGAEAARMAERSRLPDRLRELRSAIGDDEFLFQETVVRATLVDRLARNAYAFDARMHDAARHQVEALRARLACAEIDPYADATFRTVVDIVRQSTDDASGASAAVAAGTAGVPLMALPGSKFDARRRLAPEVAHAIGPVRETRGAFVIPIILDEEADRYRLATFFVEKRSWDEWWGGVAGSLDESTVQAVASESSIAVSSVRPGTGSLSLVPVERGTNSFMTSEVAASCVEDTWSIGGEDIGPRPRSGATAVWTGTLMLVWGGGTMEDLEGGSYNPATDSWTPITPYFAPRTRAGHTAVWTGTRMVIWGGVSAGLGGGFENTGGAYDPIQDRWMAISTAGAPSKRTEHTAVWAGGTMIVWGGRDSATHDLGNGAQYNPFVDQWLPLSSLHAPSPRSGHTAVYVPTGGVSQMLVWGGRNAGSTGALYDRLQDLWVDLPTVGAPAPRVDHSAIWTGSEMLVWGGRLDGAGGDTDTGGRFNLGLNAWLPMSSAGSPSAREGHTSVWTGSRMIVWGGGATSAGAFVSATDTGGQYDPAGDAWVPTSTMSAPSARHNHVAVWTGSRMVVWGGDTYQPGGSGQSLDTGGRYDPIDDTWIPMASGSAPSARYGFSMIWNGNVAIVWGGESLENDAMLFPRTGGRFDPTTDTWSALNVTGAPSGRYAHSTVWTGDRMVVWGGRDSNYLTATGGRYDPIADHWEPTTLNGAPSDRYSHTAVWTGDRMVVWGGSGYGFDLFGTGGKYDPVGDRWEPTTSNGAPSARSGHTAVWTGSRMIVWGADSVSPTGGSYDPIADAWEATPTEGAPQKRWGHTAVWTGTRMVVWGGYDLGWLGSGGLYDPATRQWSPTSSINAPDGRYDHAAIWTGSQMVVWGGRNGTEWLDTGGRYDPVGDTWFPTSTFIAPTPRVEFGAVWTGREMLVWGGFDVYGGRPREMWRYCACVSATFHRDADGDGFGDPAVSVESCGLPEGYVADATDCDDGAASVHPGAAEICNGRDDNCDGAVDEGSTLNVSADPSTLWPPNHEMRHVHVTWVAQDGCTPVAKVELLSVTSSEPDDDQGNDDGATTGDIQGVDPGTADSDLLLRSERNGRGSGRVYTLTYRAVDVSGKATLAVAVVTVPHDQGQGPEPLLMQVEPTAPGSTRLHIYWPSIVGATGYDVITGDLASWHVNNAVLSLGTVQVLAQSTTMTSITEMAASATPAVGQGFFYLIQSRTEQGATGYGTETGPWPRVPALCAGGCPGVTISRSEPRMAAEPGAPSTEESLARADEQSGWQLRSSLSEGMF